jgi:hypothetical protein
VTERGLKVKDEERGDSEAVLMSASFEGNSESNRADSSGANTLASEVGSSSSTITPSRPCRSSFVPSSGSFEARLQLHSVGLRRCYRRLEVLDHNGHVRCARIAGPAAYTGDRRVAVAEQLDDRVAAGQERHVDLGVRMLRLGGDLLSRTSVARNLA